MTVSILLKLGEFRVSIVNSLPPVPSYPNVNIKKLKYFYREVRKTVAFQNLMLLHLLQIIYQVEDGRIRDKAGRNKYQMDNRRS